MTLSRAAFGTALLLFGAGCAARAPRMAPATRYPVPRSLPRIEWSVQVGAFSNPDNALRLIESLGERGLEAFYFFGDDGLHRVRFGSFGSKELATRRAAILREEHVIGDFYVVPPEPLGTVRGNPTLRGQVVRSALSFLGRPYRWGGPSPETGFDCSGLTMTAYRLNGLALPRTSAAQYASGEPVSQDGLQEADLVFFATENNRKPSHVGLYIGEGRFVHAPSRGDVVRIDRLADGYYQRHFLAARSYLSGRTGAR